MAEQGNSVEFNLDGGVAGFAQKQFAQAVNSAVNTNVPNRTVTPQGFGNSKEGLKVQADFRFDLRDATLGGIPPNSVITRMDVELQADAIDTDLFDFSAYTPERGRWDQESFVGPLQATASTFGFRLLDAGGVWETTGQTPVSSAVTDFPLKTIAGLDFLSIGQEIIANTDTIITSCEVWCLRQGLRPGNVWVELYLSGGGLPVGSILAQSNNVPFNSLPAVPGWVNFPFSIPFATLSPNDYVATLQGDYTPNGVDFALVPQEIGIPKPYPGAASVNGGSQKGTGSAFSPANYPTANEAPNILLQDGSPASPSEEQGPIITLQAPPFNSVGQFVTISGFAPLLQAWVDDPSYIEGVVPTTPSYFSVSMAVGNIPMDFTRQFQDARLIVSWRPRNRARGAFL